MGLEDMKMEREEGCQSRSRCAADSLPFPPPRENLGPRHHVRAYMGTRPSPPTSTCHSPPMSCLVSHKGTLCLSNVHHPESCMLYQPYIDMGRVLISRVDGPSEEAAHC